MTQENFWPIAAPNVRERETDILFIKPRDVVPDVICIGPRQQTLNVEMRDEVMSNQGGLEKKSAGPARKKTKVYVEEQQMKLLYLEELIKRHSKSIKLHNREIMRLRSHKASCRVRNNQREGDHAFAEDVAYLIQFLRDPL